MRVGLLALAVLLAGCTTDAGSSLSGEGLSNVSGLVSTSPDCGTEGVLKATVKGTAGMVEATVLDAAGARIADRVTFAGDHEGELDLKGIAGTWVLELRRAGFSGDYDFRLAC